MSRPTQVPDRETAHSEGERRRREPSSDSASQESVQAKTRRQFTASEKLRLVKAADVALASGERGALEAMLRKEGIYSSQLSTWRQQLGATGEPALAETVNVFETRIHNSLVEGRQLISLERLIRGCFRDGLITDVEIRDLVLAHLETWFEHRDGRRYTFVHLDPALVLALEVVLFGRPAGGWLNLTCVGDIARLARTGATLATAGRPAFVSTK